MVAAAVLLVGVLFSANTTTELRGGGASPPLSLWGGGGVAVCTAVAFLLLSGKQMVREHLTAQLARGPLVSALVPGGQVWGSPRLWVPPVGSLRFSGSVVRGSRSGWPFYPAHSP